MGAFMLPSQTRKSIYIGLISILIVVIFLSFVLPYIKGLNRLKEDISRKEAELSQLMDMGREFIQVRNRLAIIEGAAIGSEEKEALLPSISTIASQSGVKERIKTMEMKSKKLTTGLYGDEVLVKFEGVTLSEIERFIKSIQAYSDTLHLKRVGLEARFDKPDLFDASVTIFVLEKR